MTSDRPIQTSLQTIKKTIKQTKLLSLQNNTAIKRVYKNIKSICTQWRNKIAPWKRKSVSTSVTAAFQMSQFRQANRTFTRYSCFIFYVCVFLWTWRMLHMCGSHPSTCFDKLDLPLSTENEDSALSQRAILTTQVWWWGSQTSRIPLARWFALSRWCHQDY